MHEFLRYLSRRRSAFGVGYGLTLLVFGLISGLRFFAPLNTAPFLLYMPVIFLVGVAFGRGPAFLGMVVSTGFAAWFFWSSPPYGQLSASQVLALAQYAVIGCAMVLVCDALRKVLAQNEAALVEMEGLNAALVHREATLATAKEEAEAAREQALAAQAEAERARERAEVAQGEAENAKDAAEAANMAKSSFLANMSHELRTPLSAVIGYSEMMEEEVEDIGAQALLTDLGKIKSNARHLLSLINDVLDLSKVEANRMDTFAEDVSVSALVEEAAATVGTLVAPEGQPARARGRAGRRRHAHRRGQAAPVPVQPDEQRIEVHREGHGHAARPPRGRDGRGLPRVPGVRHRDRHDRGAARQTVPALHTGRRVDHAQVRRYRPRPRPDAGLRAPARRRHLGREHVRRGHDLHAPPAGLHARAAHYEDGTPVPGRHEADERQTVLVIDDDPAQLDLMVKFLERQGFHVRTATNAAERA